MKGCRNKLGGHRKKEERGTDLSNALERPVR